MEDKIHIVLANDSKADQELFKKVMTLFTEDVTFHLTSDSDQLIENCNTGIIRPPDIIFIDFKIPRRQSLEQLKKLRACETFNESVIVIYSDFSSPQVIDQCYYFGADYYLRKTTSEKNLVEFLKRIINLRGQNNLKNTERRSFLIKL